MNKEDDNWELKKQRERQMDKLSDALSSNKNSDVDSDVTGQEIWEFYEDFKSHSLQPNGKEINVNKSPKKASYFHEPSYKV